METGGVISRTKTLNVTGDQNTPSFTGVFSLGQSPVTARVDKINALGTGYAEARIHTAGQAYIFGQGATEGNSALSGVAEIAIQAYYIGLGSGNANASASGNASYSIKENTAGGYGAVPMVHDQVCILCHK